MSDAAIEQARREGRTLLNEVESKLLLAGAGIPVTETRLATSRDEAIAAADAIGYPAVLKVIAADVSHKSDVGGVVLNLANAAMVGRAYDDLLERVSAAQPGAHIEGVSVQQMAPAGTEVIIGMTRHAQFGPVLMFGLGGILVEVLQDVAFGVVPVTDRDADGMIRAIKGFPALNGYRGALPADLAALRRTIVALSDFVQTRPEIEEIDLNPVIVYSDGAVAVDARVVLAP